MSSNRNTYKDTLQLIADILSVEHSTEELKIKLSTTQINWDQFVSIASDHLVLTTCYCRLQQKELIELLPQELSSYLKSITTINRNRNLSLLEQIKRITSIFNEYHIDYVFLKGAALLVGKYYEDLGERMIGDIDILVDNDQINDAFELLLKNSYVKQSASIKDRFFSHRHLDRLTSDDNLAAVELHYYLVKQPKENLLTTKDILNKKQHIEQIPIPRLEDLYNHNILSLQINDKAHYYSRINLRSAYDTIVMMRGYSDALKESANNYITSYFSIHSIFFKEFHRMSLDTSKIAKFKSRLHSPRLHSLHEKKLKILELLSLMPSRVNTFFKNKDYRNAIYHDRQRIFEELKAKFLKR